MRGAQSQAYTDAAAQALTLALRAALSPGDHRVHLAGFSHGSKVMGLTGLLLESPPEHLTLLDSPEGLLPVIGGALNDLAPYLRAYDIGRGPGQTFVDSYPSDYGVHYAVREGLGRVVEIAPDPDHHPLADAGGAHGYAHTWYHASGEHGVGLAWSPLMEGVGPAAGQLREASGPWQLEPNDSVPVAPPVEAAVERFMDSRRKPIMLSTDGRRSYWAVRWRRPGDLAASARLRWLFGPPDARVSLYVRGVERWRSTIGWSEEPVRKVVVPLGGVRPGPVLSRVKLTSSAPAEAELHRATIGGIRLPVFSEAKLWLHPAAAALTLPFSLFAGATAWRLARKVVGGISRSKARGRAPGRPHRPIDVCLPPTPSGP